MRASVIAVAVLAVLFYRVDFSRAQCADSYKVTSGGSNAIGKFVSDSVGNATQDANYKGVDLRFYTVGSGEGVKGWKNASYDFTIIDYPLPSKDFKTAGRPLFQIPVAFGVVSAYYNIPGFQKGYLQLSAPVAAGIWSGTIRTWDDPAILAINPNLTKIGMPAGQPITVVARSDSNAAIQAWTSWLSVAGNNTWTAGVNTTFPTWPEGFQVVTGGSNVTWAIGNTSYSIGVLDGFAGKRAKLNDSALQTFSDPLKFLRYGNADFNLTDLAGAPPIPIPPADGDWGNFSLINLPGVKTYPVITTAIIITGSDLSQLGARGRVQKQTFQYMLGPIVQRQAREYQEYGLPARFLQFSVEAANAIKVGTGLSFFQPLHLPNVNGVTANLS